MSCELVHCVWRRAGDTASMHCVLGRVGDVASLACMVQGWGYCEHALRFGYCRDGDVASLECMV